jgi:type VI secretion system secreted protein VgrG
MTAIARHMHPTTTRRAQATRVSTSNRLQIEVADGVAFDVRRLDIEQRMSTPFEIRAVAHSRDASVALGAIAGAPATVTVDTDFDGLRSWQGICRDIRLVSECDDGYSTYEIVVVSPLWFATQREDYRIFQGVSELDIVESILAAWKIVPEVRVDRAAYPPREFRVQYGETDYAFISRMLEEAGISYFYEDGSRMVIADMPERADLQPALTYEARISGPVCGRYATAVSVGHAVRPGRVTLRDHDFRRSPEFPLLVEAGVGDEVLQRLERYQYEPGSFVFESNGSDVDEASDDRGRYRADMRAAQSLVRRRLDAERAHAWSIAFETNAHALAPGQVVGLSGHPHAELEDGRRALITATTFAATAEGQWSMQVRAVSADAPFRPLPNTPKPRAIGVECATVVGSAGQEIHTDEYGRVRVHFHWDRLGERDHQSSCWIHVSQPWSGTGFGGVNIPRVGQEVLVEFLAGDPDRPVILGRLYTKTQGVPYALPAAKTRSGWRSMSSPGGGGYNELMFEDAAGQELVNIQAQKDMNTLVKHDETHRVGNDRSKSIGHDEQISVGNDRSELVGNDEQVSIGHDRKSSIGNDATQLVGNDDTTLIGGNASERVAVNRSRAVGVNESVEVGVNRSHKVGASETISIGKSQSTNVGKKQSVKVGMLKTETVGLAKTLTCGAVYQVTVGGVMNTTVAAISKEKVGFLKTIDAGSKIVIGCGSAKIILEKSGKITLEGTEIVVSGADHVQLTSDRIDLN